MYVTKIHLLNLPLSTPRQNEPFGCKTQWKNLNKHLSVIQHPGTYIQLLHTVTTQIKASFCMPSPKKVATMTILTMNRLVLQKSARKEINHITVVPEFNQSR